MRLDHVSYASEPDGLTATATRIADKLGVKAYKGGVHPRFGTQNMIIPLAGRKYIEVVKVLEHPAAEKQPYGQAVRARSEVGGGWMGWCVHAPDISAFEERLGRESVPGNRRFPDGRELSWRQIGVKGLIADPQVPYILSWDQGNEDLHPSLAGEPQASLLSMTLAGCPERIVEWLGIKNESLIGDVVEDVDIDWIAPNGTPGLLSVNFSSPQGTVSI